MDKPTDAAAPETIAITFHRAESYRVGDVTHVYRAGETYRFTADFARKWLALGSADLAEDADGVKLTPTPEPGPPATAAIAEKNRPRVAPKPAAQPTSPPAAAKPGPLIAGASQPTMQPPVHQEPLRRP